MATVGQVDEQDAFTCPICLETLKSPKSLPCLHTFCETCIGEFILSTEKRTDHKLSNYPCPVCRTVVTPTNPEDETSQWAASLPHNVTISSLMDKSQSVKQECHLCKRRDKISEATKWCCDCTEALCEECMQFHGIMKLSAGHNVVRIEEMDTSASVNEPDAYVLSDSCPVHTSKSVVAFCFDHQELSCVLCLTVQHRKCENVQVIEEMPNLKGDKINRLVFEVNDIKVKVEKIMKEKGVERDKLDSDFREIEVKTNQFISSIKDNLDDILALFIKELNITREDVKHEFENKLKTGKKLLNHFDQLQHLTKTVKKKGTLAQMFIHFEKSKTELKSILAEATQVLNTPSICAAKLENSAILDKVEKVDRLGKLELTRTNPIEMNEYVKHIFPPNCLLLKKTQPQVCFRNIMLKHNKTIYLGDFNVHGGAFISDDVVVIGGNEGGSNGSIKTINISNEKIICESTFKTTVKRLAYDFESKSLFVSCYESMLFHCLNNEFTSKIRLKECGLECNNGDICTFDGVLYVIVDNAIQRLDFTKLKDGIFENCFDTNTKCISLNGLDIDSKNKRLLYTSEDYEVVCTSLEGREIFRYKDNCLKQAQSLAVHSHGFILVADTGETSNGSIHVISEDGKERRTVLHNCYKKEPIRDICFDKFNDRLAVFEPSYVEIYDLSVEEKPKDKNRKKAR
ncbi:E3 ubiquitin-protein ligase TRIM45-like [Mytilus edulis]|uniref:E3 ubiquitin-protein ligase TRIM45-like n=1 Tax=Mytilus edulis TaxID=6550 RepID=UPI0039EFBA0A